MKITFSQNPNYDVMVIALNDIDLINKLFDAQTIEIIKNQANFFNFQAKDAETCVITFEHQNKIKCLILIGFDNKDNSQETFLNLGGLAVKLLKGLKFTKADFILLGTTSDQIANQIALGAALRSYNFEHYKSSNKIKDKFTIENLNIIEKAATKAQALYDLETEALYKSIYFSQDLISEPANILYPQSFVDRVKEEFAGLDIKIEVLDQEQMRALGMNALLGVGQGSGRESKLLVLSYLGGEKDQSPIAFVGKGVTFDTGGISLKPSASMEDMKYDMAGASIVTGLIRNLAARKAKVNVISVAGLVENMPDGNAQRPSDVVKSMSGQTIEIINTDAEGRLVLADALWYCQDRFKPQVMINLATLTGAITVALGSEFAGLFSNNEQLVKDLISASHNTGERLWQLPLDKNYDKLIDSPIADIRNISSGRGAGSITAAQFLQRFVNDTPWAHLDIAGVSWCEKDKNISPAGATGFGIRLLNDYIKKYEH